MARRTATKAKAKPAPEPEELEDEVTDDIDEVEEEPEPAPRKRRAKAKPAPVVEEEPEEEPDEDDLDEVEDEEEPVKKAGPKRAPIQYGSSWAAEIVNEKAGTQHSAYTLRALIRQMVKAGEFDRAVGEDRSRYEFTGPKDPKLVAIVQFAKKKASEPKASRSDALEKARAARAKNLAAKKAAEEDDGDVEETPAPKRRTKAKTKPAPVVEEVDADDDFEDLDDE